MDNKKNYTRILRYTLNSFEEITYDKKLKKTNYNKYFGLVVDGVNHDSIVFKGDLCLGSSFMTFVIKDNIERRKYREEYKYAFDITPYNYVFNNSTAFIDSKFA